MTKNGRKHFGAAIIEEVLQMKKEGKTNKEISVHFGFDNGAVTIKMANTYLT